MAAAAFTHGEGKATPKHPNLLWLSAPCPAMSTVRSSGRGGKRCFPCKLFKEVCSILGRMAPYVLGEPMPVCKDGLQNGFWMCSCLPVAFLPSQHLTLSSSSFAGSLPWKLASTQPRSLFNIRECCQPWRADNIGAAQEAAAVAGCADCIFTAQMVVCCGWGRKGSELRAEVEGVKFNKRSVRSVGLDAANTCLSCSAAEPGPLPWTMLCWSLLKWL